MTDGNDTTGGADTGVDTSTSVDATATEQTSLDTATPETNTGDFLSLVKSDGTFVDAWQESLKGEEYADVRATAANYKSMPELLKSLKESKSAAMQRLDGMVRVPGENATPEEIAAYREAVGVPESPDGYEFTPPEGVELNDEALGDFRKAAAEIGLTSSQAQKLVEFQLASENGASARADEAHKAAIEAGTEELRKEFGGQFDAKIAAATRVAATFGLDPNNQLFDNPDAVRAFAKIADAVSEDKLVTGTQMQNKLGPESMADDILYNKSNPMNEAFHNSNHPQHSEAKAAFEKHMKDAFPSQ